MATAFPSAGDLMRPGRARQIRENIAGENFWPGDAWTCDLLPFGRPDLASTIEYRQSQADARAGNDAAIQR